MHDRRARIQVNGKEVQNPLLRKLIGAIAILALILLLVGGVLLLVFLPYVLVIALMAVMVTLGVLTILASPLDWVLKRMGRRGIIHRNGRGSFSLILDNRIFQRTTSKK